MNIFMCPVCGEDLSDNGKNLICKNGHNYDKSRKGYVNLLTDNKIKQHGDDKLMIKARHDFLNKDYYRPLLDKIIELLLKYVKDGDIILDAGCGEGWYTKQIKNALPYSKIAAVDISKEALSIANLDNSVVASVYKLPIKNKSVNTILNIFSPFSIDEYSRVLTDNGLILYVIPLEYHLFGLKSLLYDDPILNEVKSTDIDGYRLLDKIDIKYTIEINNNDDIKKLFAMTPYYYKTGKPGHDLIQKTDNLKTQIEFCILIYRIGD